MINFILTLCTIWASLCSVDSWAVQNHSEAAQNDIIHINFVYDLSLDSVESWAVQIHSEVAKNDKIHINFLYALGKSVFGRILGSFLAASK